MACTVMRGSSSQHEAVFVPHVTEMCKGFGYEHFVKMLELLVQVVFVETGRNGEVA